MAHDILMNIYFFYSNKEKIHPVLSRVDEVLRLSGNHLITNREKSELQFKQQDIAEARQSGQGLASRIHGFILDLSEPHQEAGYFLALAALYQRPCLCLFPRGYSSPLIDHYIRQMKRSPRIMFRAFTRGSIRQILQQFSDSIREGLVDKDDIPSLKYTLRISPRIDRYLRWKTANTEWRKADYLRNTIQGMMDKDEDYKKLSGEGEREEEE